MKRLEKIKEKEGKKLNMEKRKKEKEMLLNTSPHKLINLQD
jgi:hypothetical protein